MKLQKKNTIIVKICCKMHIFVGIHLLQWHLGDFLLNIMLPGADLS